ncbi:MAG: PD-(D/E)XK nuclease family protein [Pseudomonadota bacterium]
MYRWLIPAVDEGAAVLTANLRLARVLSDEYADAMLAAGKLAWTSPPIMPYRQWLAALLDSAAIPAPVRLSRAQTRVLWERCLIDELGESPPNLAALVRAAEDAWAIAAAFAVPPEELTSRAENRDQGVFARALRRYRSQLEDAGWIDDEQLASRVRRLLQRGELAVPKRLVVAGFDRIVPAQAALLAALGELGCSLDYREQQGASRIPVRACMDKEAEWRAAGAWARGRLLASPDERVAVVVTGLERNRDAVVRLVREGLLPGWQTDAAAARAAVNVSLGATLDSYPLIAVALLMLRWLSGSLSSRQLGVVLRSNSIGLERSDARARLELRLRDTASREWTLKRVLRVFERHAVEPDTEDFVTRLKSMGALLAERPARATPSAWAAAFDALLAAAGWPGEAALGSAEQQLVNRWRDLLNEFAELERVSGTQSLAEAAARIRQLAADAVFQPEDTGAVLSVLGPLEAAGLEFDALYVTGLDAGSWPPQSRPTPLIARSLRMQYQLPDATAEDTRAFSSAVLERLSGSAATVHGSYARNDGDSEQTVTALAAVIVDEATAVATAGDSGWYATQLRDRCAVEIVQPDRVPEVANDERVRGGAGTIDRQLREPFSAFASGRLGIRRVGAFTDGLTPLLRGNLLHEALFNLYSSRPSQEEIRAWLADGAIDKRLESACRRAVARHRIAAGETLERLFDFEERRMQKLLELVLELDCERPPFSIASVEGRDQGLVGGLALSLRHDRIDRSADGSLQIIDYKTGARKRFMAKGQPADYQLVVYAAMQKEAVSDLGLFNVDSRAVAIDGAGVHFGNSDDFAAGLGRWIETVADAAAEIRKGDVRINRALSAKDARGLALLSRYRELVRDAG